MTTYSSPGGWRDRTKKTAEKAQSRADLAEIRAARAQADIAKSIQDASDVERFEAENRAHKLACPCCRGEGRVTVEMAELLYRALEKLPSDSRPDPVILANLGRIARGEAVHTHTPKISHGLSHPAPVATVETATTSPDTVKKRSNVNCFTEDGALIELGD